MNFREFIEQQELNELFATPTPPQNGQWQDGGLEQRFYFNIPEDPSCAATGGRCYLVTFSNQGDTVSVAFKPNYKSYDAYQATGANVEQQVGNGVVYALSDYISHHKPERLSWSPTIKQNTDRNKEARKKVYALWMKKNMFPDHYIPCDPSNPAYPTRWMSRELYDKKYVPQGLPEIDSGAKRGDLFLSISSAFQKHWEKEQQERQAAWNTEQERRRAPTPEERERWERQAAAQRAEEEANRQRENERQRQIMLMISDPRHNPAKIGIGDMVQSRSGRYWHRGRVVGFMMGYDGDLEARVTDKVDRQGQPGEDTMLAPDGEKMSDLQKVSAGMFGKEKLSR